MQISRCILLAAVTSTALAPIIARSGQDSQAQAKARQALEQSMGGSTVAPAVQMQPPATPATNQPAPPPSVVPGRKAPQPPATAKAKALEDALHQKMNESAGRQPGPTESTMPVVTPALSAPPAQAATARPLARDAARPGYEKVVLQPEANPEAIAKAQEALRQQLSQPAGENTPPPVVIVPPEPSQAESDAKIKEAAAKEARAKEAAAKDAVAMDLAAKEAKAKEAAIQEAKAEAARAAATEAQAKEARIKEAAAKTAAAKEAAAQEKARAKEAKAKQKEAALEKKASSEKVKPAAEQAQARPQKEEKPTAVNKFLEFPPVQAPPPPVALSKEQRLQELLQLYRADRITPVEYHAQRAKILSEP